jgi:4-hydroxy-3-polyprenylbenzoate decarboxylase
MESEFMTAAPKRDYHLVIRCRTAASDDMPEPNSILRNITVAITGASGSILPKTLLDLLERDERIGTVNLIISDSGLRVVAEELAISGRSELLLKLLGRAPHKIRQQNNDDIGANIASGSYPTDAMIVLPCSMGTLARIANGIANQLIERAADVCLKERRPLVLCVRETPFNRIHLRNMTLASEAGATIFPVIPAFYFKPASTEEIAREFANRVLAHVGLPQADAYRWKSD